MTQTYVTLNNGLKMPQVGLGVFQVPDGEKTYNAVLAALKCGYRKIDTAHAYQNERSVGKAIKDSGIPRSEIWITSKLWINEYGEGKTLPALEKMLARLGVDYIDLVYLHQPFGDVKGAWKDLEKAVEQKKARSIGISDFDYRENMFTDFVDSVNIKPVTLQIECHPFAQRKNFQALAAKYNILIECWYPFGGRQSNGVVLKDPTINKIAQAHNCSATQVILRFDVQVGLLPLPGSLTPAHIEDNFKILNFTLSEEEMKEMRALNKEQRFFTMNEEQSNKNLSAWAVED